MSTLVLEVDDFKVQDVTVGEDTLEVDLNDGRSISAPLAWYPRLLNGTVPERRNWRLIGGGEGVHWPDLDEDISVENLLSGKPSGEGQQSFLRWLEGRRYRRQHGKDTWHFCSNCSFWPTSGYDTSNSRPTSGELCNECQSRQSADDCR
jgi:Protein of unknown function (DUF2442)